MMCDTVNANLIYYLPILNVSIFEGQRMPAEAYKMCVSSTSYIIIIYYYCLYISTRVCPNKSASAKSPYLRGKL